MEHKEITSAAQSHKS